MYTCVESSIAGEFRSPRGTRSAAGRRGARPALFSFADMRRHEFTGSKTMAATQDAVLDLIFGRWRSQILYAGVELGVFEALHDGTKDAAAIAGELELDPELCYRLMRALGALALLREEEGRRFSITDAGRFLLGDHP